jgi:hypothetical protein
MRVTKAIIVILFSVFCASAQQPPASPSQPPVNLPANPPPAIKDPVSPDAAQLQREKQIRMYDPLDKSDPVLGDRIQGVDIPDPKSAASGSAQPALVRPAPASRPLPGSVAESNRGGPANPKNPGPQVLSEDGEAPVQEYTGPAVLSRSYTISRPMTPEQVKWSPSVGYMESYDSGLNGAVAVPGTNGSSSPLGYSLNWGLVGRHFWKHDQIGIDYRGAETKIGGISSRGTNQSLNLDYEHQVSRHLIFNLVSSASSLSQAYSLANPGLALSDNIANINLSASPTLQVLDLGTRQLSNQASMTWRKSARLSFTASSGIFFVQRAGGLFGNTGFQSQADVNYRYTRKTTIGVYYSHTNYTYTHRVNLSDMNTVGGIYSYALGRSTQIRLRAGITRIENEGQQTVRIDPAIAIYLGQSTGVIEAYNLTTTSDVSAEIVRDFGRKGTASLSYVRGVSPGNGLLLASIQEGLSANFSRKLSRQYILGVTAGRSSLTAVGQASAVATPFGSYKSQSLGMSLSRPLNHHLNADFRVDYRIFDIGLQPGLNHQLRISTGLNWSPGENWLKSW